MAGNEIKNGEVYIDGVPYSKWTPEHWQKWRQQTVELQEQCNRMYQKLSVIAQKWSMK